MAAPFTRGLRKRPSDAVRWTRCTASLRFTKDYPNESSGAADEGTAAHWVREMSLDLGFDAYDWIGTKLKINGVIYECDDDMADALQPGIDEIREFQGKMYNEVWVDTTPWVGLDENGKRQGGTVDCAVIGTDLIVLSDLKFGRGVPVQAVKNDQQMLYALALYHMIAKGMSKATNFLIIIDQPRNSAGGGYWHTTLEELEAYGRKVINAAKEVDSDEACFTPGEEQCRWCPAANVPGRPGGCPAHSDDMMSSVELTFDDLDGPEVWTPPIVDGMTIERLIQIHDKASGIKKWLDYCHARVIQHLLDEGPTGGKKAVYGRRPARKWASLGAAEAFMLQKLPSTSTPFNKKLKSPSQLEKEVGKKYEVPLSLLDIGEPKPTVTDIDDDRPAITALVDDFDDLGEDPDVQNDFDDLGDETDDLNL